MNIDQQEVQKFSELAEKWWDKSGDFKPLHVINPLRANYIASKVDLTGKKILDVGCGGGILAEALSDAGAIVTGIDAAGPGIEIAKLHAQDNNKSINYMESTAEDLLNSSEEKFDIVTCLEVLEHVPDPELLVRTCINLLKSEGDLFLSTINKNPRSWITAIVGAEYIFNILPKGTHEFNKFIKPSSLGSFIRRGSAELIESKGMFYNPITHKAHLNNDLGVNYLMYAKKS
ncbi:bifunctional 2-polyprenyl-6-hydroxyphenol methylase/3-demethylubiquinol 3-O-methyltransferase UbiG [Gammaproteobacteria bacterium]|jgi:2-polyprenyl-6-hydroxyphenyl methylase/3-demethylubiquinone-9 3-methyltransferase|nr:bifunctional 2-polyprenyl-6-hydroxyphenol methylase/3-demethylubiquinol 3-O-methyltransferase UbiG [Gammaproteobacteria bacterium]MDA9804446.1 bifunctional 2-polyprenyl-6-hydroxyphenol methylase/3-demethylubiquinol 3-O-methyltransferase UbiG [Gammaproteobacteria bacterium]MDA9815121.1 bifunctional 2-polyprenyl-6-hydroxyphenol methylase/3-demethylubiquinol 3-O-methyltransferase UbiG [Gammaproteobacteria bacterium]MDA9866963.1 bifunctional 2-polyprenyl-6-hydroxyphenol methylase/3-demethylubiqui|tara:strand:- start:7278 stop:7970 length:693 start_codon:yes stop_codon:yes gene_type:complete